MNVAQWLIGACALGLLAGCCVGWFAGRRSSVDNRVGRVLEQELRLPRLSDSKWADEAEEQGHDV